MSKHDSEISASKREFHTDAGFYSIDVYTLGTIIIKDQRWTTMGITVSSRPWELPEFQGIIPKGWVKRLFTFADDIQLVNIGGGLDDTARFAMGAKRPPILIDPLDPLMLRNGMEDILRVQTLPVQTLTEAHRIIGILDTLRNPSAVRHIQKTFEQAMIDHSTELIGSADIVMDIEAASAYGEWTHQHKAGHETILRTERTLLKPDGLKQHWYSNAWVQSGSQ